MTCVFRLTLCLLLAPVCCLRAARLLFQASPFNVIIVCLPQIDRRTEFDQVVIETTGLANPHAIIRVFSMVQDVWDNMALDAVVTLVDAKHIDRQLDEERPPDVDNEALKQIAYADRIILNKIDLVHALSLLESFAGQIEAATTWSYEWSHRWQVASNDSVVG